MTPRSPYIITLDQGTTSCRAIAFDATGDPVAFSQLPIAQSYPHPGWVEEDPVEILNTQIQVLRVVTSQLTDLFEADSRQIAGIGITNQRSRR